MNTQARNGLTQPALPVMSRSLALMMRASMTLVIVVRSSSGLTRANMVTRSLTRFSRHDRFAVTPR